MEGQKIEPVADAASAASGPSKERPCCKADAKPPKGGGFLQGILYGLLPHTGCIAFLALTIAGATGAAAFLKPLMLNAWFFQGLIALSFALATASAAYYLYRNDLLSAGGIRAKWKYLSILYGTTILVNVLMFTVIFPYSANFTANLASGPVSQAAFQGAAQSAIAAAAVAQPATSTASSLLTLDVAIPCSGHAPLIIGELKKTEGVLSVTFRSVLFDVKYDPSKTSPEKILSIEIFKTYAAKQVN